MHLKTKLEQCDNNNNNNLFIFNKKKDWNHTHNGQFPGSNQGEGV